MKIFLLFEHIEYRAKERGKKYDYIFKTKENLDPFDFKARQFSVQNFMMHIK